MILFENLIRYILIPFGTHMLSYWLTVFILIYFDKKNNIYNVIGYDKYYKAIKGSLINQLTITLPAIYFCKEYLSKSIIYASNDTILLSVIKLFWILNFINGIFYLIHRLLHQPMLYKYIHKIHHEYIEPIAPSALYAHPIEHLMGNNFAFILPIIIIRLRYDILLLSICLASVNVVLSHSSYMKYILKDNNDHYIHHKKFNYNYGLISYIDKLFGTFRET
jgi:sterol desaturase/sphingolipid hydroxylase (fatty acid hydroxylase superfamily)